MQSLRKLILGFILISGTFVWAQDSAVSTSVPESNQGWKGNAGFSAVLNSGNATNQTLGGNGNLSNRWDDNKVSIDGTGAYGRAKDSTGVTTTNVKNWRTLLRYDRYLTETFGAFSYGFMGQDEPAGFENRFGAGAGIGHDFYRTVEDLLRYELGYDLTRELRVPPAIDDYIHSARVFFQYKRNISTVVSFTQDVETLVNLESSEDLRLNTLSSLTTKLSDRLAFQIGFGVRFDNEPVAGFRKTDTQTQAGLVVNFL